MTDALAKAVAAYGGEIRLGAPVHEILRRRPRAAGVAWPTGTNSRPTWCSRTPTRRPPCCGSPAAALPGPIRERVQGLRSHGSGAKINFALAELPDFLALPGRTLGPQHCGGIMIAPSLDYLDQAWDEGARGLPSRRPFSQMVIQSATDPTVASSGRHTLSLWCHHFPYQLAAGDLDQERERLGERMTDLISEPRPTSAPRCLPARSTCRSTSSASTASPAARSSTAS